MSKATPRGAVAKFAAVESPARKDLGMMAISYGNVYVAQIAMAQAICKRSRLSLKPTPMTGRLSSLLTASASPRL